MLNITEQERFCYNSIKVFNAQQIRTEKKTVSKEKTEELRQKIRFYQQRLKNIFHFSKMALVLQKNA